MNNDIFRRDVDHNNKMSRQRITLAKTMRLNNHKLAMETPNGAILKTLR